MAKLLICNDLHNPMSIYVPLLENTPRSEPIEPQKEVKELKEYKEGPTPNFAHARDKAETASPFYCAACGYIAPTCVHRVFEVVRSTPTGAMLRVGLQGGRASRASP